jgi:hypothetical protein
MVNKCAYRQFYTHSLSEKIGLCARVKKVTALFIGLNGGGQQKDDHKNREEISPISMDDFTFKIWTLALHDLIKSQADQQLSFDEKIEIQDEVLKIAKPSGEVNLENRATFYLSIRENLAKAF